MDILKKSRQALKKRLDYNRDNVIDTKDIIDATNDIEEQLRKMSEQLKEQLNNVMNEKE